ncbi:Plasmodium exported protein, unknown function [Plasmodium malariae]|uniref:Variable surface protein n=1 Tax=Plasmodium malariae TaxID=5858 RepID=A0A1D3JHH5_PLAMA|nr:Plasmodium exported protein, unknown function [Plasmodium malariae]SBT85794.1 Plasmodium exported protein, unknown function [Plasmodium malariae]
MEQKKKMLFLINISTFVFLPWVCLLYSDMLTCNHLLVGDYKLYKKLHTRTYRLLTKCKHKRYSNIAQLKQEIPNNTVGEKKNIFINEKVNNGKKKHSNERSLNNVGIYEQTRKYKTSVHTRTKLNFEKRVLGKLYYKNTVRFTMNADFKFLKYTITRKLGMMCAVYIFYIILGIVIYALIHSNDMLCSKSFIFNLLWCNVATIAYAMSLLIVIPSLYYIYRKIAKYIKLIYKKSEMHNTDYPYPRKVVFKKN